MKPSQLPTLLSLLSTLAPLLGASVVACSDDPPATASSDGDAGDEADPDEDRDDDARDAATSPVRDAAAEASPRDSGSPSAYCRTEIARSGRCLTSSTCNSAEWCAGVEPTLRASYETSRAACNASTECRGDLMACTFRPLMDEPRSAAQLDLASEFCAACGASAPANCTTAVWKYPSAAGEVLSSVAYFGAMLDDTHVAALAQECVSKVAGSAGGTCDDRFGACAVKSAAANPGPALKCVAK